MVRDFFDALRLPATNRQTPIGRNVMGMKQMGARFLFIGTISLCLVPASERAQAQDAPEGREVLPAIEVDCPGGTASARPARSRNAPRATRNMRRVFVYPTAPTPTAGTGMDVDKVAASVNAVGAGQIARTDSLNIADALQQHVPGLILSDTTGNPFMPDIQYRGFVASPVAGTPQGLAVYQNGMRINEAFGDTVNWDLIPTAAIRSVTVVTNNPAFGLNALGGAVNVLMKDGFNYSGAEINTMGGSFGRIQSSAQYGKRIDNFSVYGALEGLRENGFRNFWESSIRRFYGDVGYRTDSSEFHLNMGVANNKFGAAATVPVELLQNYWGATYTTPQSTANQVAYVNLTGKVEATPTWTIEGSARVRAFRQKTVDGNPTETEPCAADPGLLCFNDDDRAGQRPQRSPARKSVPCRCRTGADRPDHDAFDDDGWDLAGDQHRPVVRTQQSIHGRRQYQLRRYPVRGQCGIGNRRFELCRQRQRYISRAIRRARFRSARSRFEPPTATPVSTPPTRST